MGALHDQSDYSGCINHASILPSVQSTMHVGTEEDNKSWYEESSDATENNEQVFRRFIQLYESLPQLWDSTNPLYTHKNKKNEGYKILLQAYKKIKPNATEADLKRQINSLRSNYRREQKKMKHSMRTATKPIYVYKPANWKFYALSFLRDLESPPPREVQTVQPVATLSSLNKQTNIHKTNKQTQNQLACDNLSADSVNAAQSDDEYLNVAKVWANKLKRLHPMQRKLAEKAVNDILFEADMENLHRESVHINCGHTVLIQNTAPSR